MTLEDFYALETNNKKELLTQCCGSSAWVEKMIAAPKVKDPEYLLTMAEEKWRQSSEQDYLEAFEHHPKIGDIDSLKKKFAGTAHLAANEQSGVNVAPDKVLEALAKGNDDYEKKFGYIFIVCATGKSAEEMLAILLSRLPNSPEEEIKNAAEEQNKITKLRMQKVFL